MKSFNQKLFMAGMAFGIGASALSAVPAVANIVLVEDEFTVESAVLIEDPETGWSSCLEIAASPDYTTEGLKVAEWLIEILQNDAKYEDEPALSPNLVLKSVDNCPFSPKTRVSCEPGLDMQIFNSHESVFDGRISVQSAALDDSAGVLDLSDSIASKLCRKLEVKPVIHAPALGNQILDPSALTVIQQEATGDVTVANSTGLKSPVPAESEGESKQQTSTESGARSAE